jgi:hypothetical protein
MVKPFGLLISSATGLSLPDGTFTVLQAKSIVTFGPEDVFGVCLCERKFERYSHTFRPIFL